MEVGKLSPVLEFVLEVIALSWELSYGKAIPAGDSLREDGAKVLYEELEERDVNAV